MKSDVKIVELSIFPENLKSELVKPKITKLWYRGVWDQAIFEKCVAVVGSRKMSRYGRQVLGEILPRLCGAGYTIVSGLMYGVDQEAHKIALENGGRTIGVLGYGHGVKIEDGADRLQEKIIESGGLVVSEYPSGAVPQRFMFLQRNRIVVAFSELVIVAEAGAKSGSLHTAGLAVKQCKSLYAVPGSIFSPTSTGTNNLIALGIAKALNVENLDLLCAEDNVKLSEKYIKHRMDEIELNIYSTLKLNGPLSVNELSRNTGVVIGVIQSKLPKLELGGVLIEERGIWRVR